MVIILTDKRKIFNGREGGIEGREGVEDKKNVGYNEIVIQENQPYKKLLTYRYSYLIYFLNDQFTSRYLNDFQNRRNKEQMDQATRSSKQCIAEGAMQGTSLKGYIKMLGVSRGSYEELLEDYKDILIKEKLEIWDWKDERFRGYRRYRIFLDINDTSTPPIPSLPQNKELAANIMVDVIIRECYLLDRQKKSLEEKHMREGGFTEKLYRQRIEYRKSNKF